jgi:HlyD family secretion protein
VQALEVRNVTAEREHGRAQKLLADSVLSQQEFDRVERDYLVVVADLEAARLNRRKVDDDLAQVTAEIARVEKQLRDCHVRAPSTGTVLVKYAEPGEFVQVGQPLFKLANLDTMELRAYFGEPQLAQVRIGAPATVSIDAADGTHHTFTGRISWVSSEAEFTPTPIQTREERQDLVYAAKIRVPNPEGMIKIGMPADVQLSPPPP